MSEQISTVRGRLQNKSVWTLWWGWTPSKRVSVGCQWSRCYSSCCCSSTGVTWRDRSCPSPPSADIAWDGNMTDNTDP